jgi:hypothetical protein
MLLSALATLLTEPTASVVAWMLGLTITAISVRFCLFFSRGTSAQDTSTRMVLLPLNQYVADVLTAETLPKTISGLLALTLIRIRNWYG